MLYRRCLLLLLASCVTFSFAMPVPDMDKELSLATREPSNDDLGDVFLKARGPPRSRTEAANQVVHRQTNRQFSKISKKRINKEKYGAKIGSASQWNAASRERQKNDKDRRRSTFQFQSTVNAAERKEREKEHPKPPRIPKQSPPTPLKTKEENQKAKSDWREELKKERKRIGAELKDAAGKMKNTQNLPDRPSKFDHELPRPVTGKDVRKAVMLYHLNEKKPVGDMTSYPKIVANRGLKNPTKEYPVGGWGWTGSHGDLPSQNRILMSGNTFNGITGAGK